MHSRVFYVYSHPASFMMIYFFLCVIIILICRQIFGADYIFIYVWIWADPKGSVGFADLIAVCSGKVM